MKISTKGRYGARAMLELAVRFDEGLMRASEIAENQGISLKYLEALLSSLKCAGLIVSERGKQGGYSLARSPAEISLHDVLSVLEDSMDFVHCTENSTGCERIEQCVTRDVWLEVKEATDSILKRTTLAELLRRRQELETSRAERDGRVTP